MLTDNRCRFLALSHQQREFAPVHFPKGPTLLQICPNRGVYKIEGFHRFSRPGFNAPPFQVGLVPQPAPPATLYFQADGYMKAETPVDLGLQVTDLRD
jgi:hypothetical protein